MTESLRTVHFHSCLLKVLQEPLFPYSVVLSATCVDALKLLCSVDCLSVLIVKKENVLFCVTVTSFL